MLDSLKMLAGGLADTVAPARCLRCLREGTWLCESCRRTFRTQPAQPCVGCGREQPRGLTCARCRPDLPLVGVRSIGRYGIPWLKRGVHWLKFRGVHEVAQVLAPYLVAELTAIAPLAQLQQEAVLLPIPLHQRRWRQRGFNQSALLAQAIADLTDISISEAIVRTRFTHPQTQLAQTQRSSNVARAFALQENTTRLKRIAILVDDVATSGSTLQAAAQVVVPLPAVQQVWGLTVARG